jgi:hypothetical protein
MSWPLDHRLGDRRVTILILGFNKKAASSMAERSLRVCDLRPVQHTPFNHPVERDLVYFAQRFRKFALVVQIDLD